MIDCEAMRDRMPDVAHGTSAWTDAETAHLAACAECAREWQIVRDGAMLYAGLDVATDRIAKAVMTRLRTEPAEARVIRRIPWRGSLIGLIAAAASVMLVLYAPRVQRNQVADSSEAVAFTVLPELQVLSDSELEAVLQSLGPTAGDATPGTLPHLEDLTDNELELLLHAKGGE